MSDEFRKALRLSGLLWQQAARSHAQFIKDVISFQAAYIRAMFSANTSKKKDKTR